MATRDRTALFLRYRAEADELHGGTLSNGATSRDLRSRVGHAPPPDGSSHVGPAKRVRGRGPSSLLNVTPLWVQLHTDLVGDMTEIDKALSSLSSMYAKHLLPSFGTSGEHTDLEASIAEASSNLSRLLHTADSRVRRLVAREAGSAKQSANETEVRRNVQRRFASQLQELSQTFRSKQKDYLAALENQRASLEIGHGQSSTKHSRNSSRSFAPVYDMDGDHVEDAGLLASDSSIQIQEQGGDIRDRIAEQRAEELAEVARSIEDLATIVKDLASMVVDQGTLLDRIDYNLEEVVETTGAAVTELKIAERYQRKRHAFWCILILAIGCGVMGTLLVLKWFA